MVRSVLHTPLPALNMDMDIDPPGQSHHTYVEDEEEEVRTEPQVSTFNPTNASQCDCSQCDSPMDMQNPWEDEGFQFCGFSADPEDPLNDPDDLMNNPDDPRYPPSEYVIIRLPEDPTDYQPLEVAGDSNNASQRSGSCDPVQAPQSINPGRSSEVCMTPTCSPLRVVAYNTVDVSAENRNHQLATVSHNARPIRNQRTTTPLTLTCPHTDCDPPSDVGYLSRRFRENMNWVLGRESAINSLADKRTGCESS